MIRLEKREDKSTPTRHEFDIYYHDGERGEKKVGRAFFLKSEEEGDSGRLNMMERQNINPKKYGEYSSLSQEAITALVDKARELGIKRLFLERRKYDPEEFHDFLKELGFEYNGLLFEISLDEKKPFDWDKARGALKKIAGKSRRLKFWKK